MIYRNILLTYLQPHHPDHQKHYFLVTKVGTRKEEERERGTEVAGRMTAIQDRFWNRLPRRVVTMGTRNRSPQTWGRYNISVSSEKTWIFPRFSNRFWFLFLCTKFYHLTSANHEMSLLAHCLIYTV